MDPLVAKLSSLDITVSSADINKPDPLIVQKIYKSLLLKGFSISESALSQPRLEWLTDKMSKDLDLYSRSLNSLILCRFLQSIINDHSDFVPDSPQLPLNVLINPTAKETRYYLSILTDLCLLKRETGPLFEKETQSLNAQQQQAQHLELMANVEENRLEQRRSERDVHLRMEHHLRESQQKRAALLEELNKEATDLDQVVGRMIEDEERIKKTMASKDDELLSMDRRSHELDYNLIDDPEKLRNEVDALRVRKVEQQKLQESERKECHELSTREEHCRRADKEINTIHEEFSVSVKTVNKIEAALQEQYEKKALLEEMHDQVESKINGIEKKREERASYTRRHEEERMQKMRRMESMAESIRALRSECEQLSKQEGSVKKSVVESRQRLNALKNEKSNVIAELVHFIKNKTELIEKFQTRLEEKRTHLCELENAYKKGKAQIEEAMSTNELDLSITATVQLTDV